MARSRRKHPFHGITTTESEKDDKRRAHRVERHTIRQRLHAEPEADTLPHTYEFSDPWSYGKDGKLRITRWDVCIIRRLMRK